jgi:RimJ/RimL family protein N-acetyltransferase
LFADLARYHLSILSTLDGTTPGGVWVDDATQPEVAFMETVEGDFVTGNALSDRSDDDLRDTIPVDAALILEHEGWEARLPQIWSNNLARAHRRHHYVCRELQLTDWASLIPQGFELIRAAELLDARELKNYGRLMEVFDNFGSPDAFTRHGFGLCLTDGETIVTRCLTDCTSGSRCEIGIWTDPTYRRRGLAAATVAAMVEHCLSEGFEQIGWHCLENNLGSIRTAERVGFSKVLGYVAYSSGFPAENPDDLSPAEWSAWAEYAIRVADAGLSSRYYAAEAWTLAGEPERAFETLFALVDGGWYYPPHLLQENAWPLIALHDEPRWRAFLSRLEANRS